MNAKDRQTNGPERHQDLSQVKSTTCQSCDVITRPRLFLTYYDSGIVVAVSDALRFRFWRRYWRHDTRCIV